MCGLGRELDSVSCIYILLVRVVGNDKAVRKQKKKVESNLAVRDQNGIPMASEEADVRQRWYFRLVQQPWQWEPEFRQCKNQQWSQFRRSEQV